MFVLIFISSLFIATTSKPFDTVAHQQNKNYTKSNSSVSAPVQHRASRIDPVLTEVNMGDLEDALNEANDNDNNDVITTTKPHVIGKISDWCRRWISY
ncbi:hypothetical protein ACH3XW_28460 [Acanthocheilonema viteae]|uniref:Uncharacterized protein n=1 Tax=Acanthocheilonema viteae TaxID=6277 RepID=A0A498STJ1_ACAVI|nr:unnamed protein product [Acanthocheilonema viteae]